MTQDLDAEKILITAGATREEIDPVRFISNHSSGKMGFALAAVARSRGATVTLVAGATCIEPPPEIKFRRAISADEMHRVVMKEITSATVFIAAAAVADYRPVRRAADKIKKSGATLTLELEPTPDILLDVSRKRHENLLVVGFAAETTDLLEHARAKLERKNLDLIVANDVSKPGSVFDAETNQVVILRRNEPPLELPLLPKQEVAHRILDATAAVRREMKQVSVADFESRRK